MTSSIALAERLKARNENENCSPRVNAVLKVEPMSAKRAYGAQAIVQGESGYPDRLIRRLGTDAPKTIKVVGPSASLSLPLTAFLCSKETPGATILKAFDQAAAWRDTGQCVISGFHSPLEQQILDILLRGKQPIVMALARSVGACGCLRHKGTPSTMDGSRSSPPLPQVRSASPLIWHITAIG